jgi:hypothetical protein
MMLVSMFLVLEQQMLESQDVVRWHTIPATPPQLRRTIAEEGHVNDQLDRYTIAGHAVPLHGGELRAELTCGEIFQGAKASVEFGPVEHP